MLKAQQSLSILHFYIPVAAIYWYTPSQKQLWPWKMLCCHNCQNLSFTKKISFENWKKSYEMFVHKNSIFRFLNLFFVMLFFPCGATGGCRSQSQLHLAVGRVQSWTSPQLSIWGFGTLFRGASAVLQRYPGTMTLGWKYSSGVMLWVKYCTASGWNGYWLICNPLFGYFMSCKGSTDVSAVACESVSASHILCLSMWGFFRCSSFQKHVLCICSLWCSKLI